MTLPNRWPMTRDEVEDQYQAERRIVAGELLLNNRDVITEALRREHDRILDESLRASKPEPDDFGFIAESQRRRRSTYAARLTDVRRALRDLGELR